MNKKTDRQKNKSALQKSAGNRKAEETSVHGEDKLKAILDSIEDGYYEIDLSGNFVFFNDALCRIHGRSREELTGLNYRQYLDEENINRAFQAYNKVYLTGEPNKECEWLVRRKDGTEIYIEVSISLQKDSSGRPIGFRGIIRDITARKKAEILIKENEEKYRLLAEHMKDAVWITDLNLNVTYVSPSAVNILGWTDEEFKQLPLDKLFTPASFKEAIDFYSMELPKALAAPPDYVLDRTLELEFIGKNGQTVWGECMFSLMRDDHGQPVAILGESRNITERKKAEEALINSEALYRLLADNISEHVWIMDLNLKPIYLSPSAEKLYGYTIDELRKISFKKLYTEESVQIISEAFKNEFTKAFVNPPPAPGTRRVMELQARHKDGRLLWIENSLHFIRDENGKPISLMGETRDITERKLAQEALKKSEEQYRLLADHMKDQVWLMDLNLNIHYVSPSVERLLGYSSDEIKKMPWDKLLTPESLKKATDFTSVRMPKAMRESSKDLTFRTLELEFVLKNGQTIWGECSFSFIRDERGKPVSILGEARNITERKIAEEKLQQTLDSLKKAVGTTIQVLVSALEARDPYTAGHQSRSANLACAIAAEMGLDDHTIEGLRLAGNIHDIGKLSIPTEILAKPTKLTNLEFSLIKVHAQSGYDMLKDVESPWPLAQIVHQHHERMNGTGYPQNLKGDEILIEARIMAVADVVEAMASHRPYRASLGMEAALNEIEKNKGILYDEAVADACLRLFRERRFQLD